MGDRMRETERPGVKAEAFGRVGFCAVLGIANDRAAGIREVDLPVKLFAGVFIYSAPGYNPDINAWKFDHVSIKTAE